MAAIGEPFIRDTSAQDVTLDPAPRMRKRRRLLIGGGVAGLAILMAVFMLIRSWASTSVVVPRERVRIATVTRGTFVRDVAAQGTVVVANSPTLFASGVGTVNFLVKAGDAVAEGQVLAKVDSPSLRSEHAREKAALDGLTVSLDRASIDARRRFSKANRQPISPPPRSVPRSESSNAQQSAWNQGVIPKRDLDKAHGCARRREARLRARGGQREAA